MRIEVGKSYRFVRDDGGLDEVVTVDRVDGDGDFWFNFTVPVMLVGLGAKTRLFANAEGQCVCKAGRLVDDLAEAQVRAVVAAETKRPVVTPAPLLGDDPGSLDRFRRVFATWDFSSFA